MRKPTKVFYSLREVAKEVDEPKSTITYWEKTFDGISPTLTDGGTRRYRQKDIDRLLLIRSLLRERGLTIEGAKKELKKSGNDLEIRQDIHKRLQHCVQQLRELRGLLAQKSDKS